MATLRSVTRQSSRPSTREAQALLNELLRQGYSVEEADLALRDAGFVPPGVTAGYGAAGHPSASAPGRTSYLLGLLAWLPIPVVSVLIAGAAMAAAYPAQRTRSALAAENARRAANWGVTYALGVVLSIATTLVLDLAAPGAGTTGSEPTPWQLLSLSPIFVLGFGHLLITIIGLRRTSRGELFQPPAVPFFRAVADPEVERLVEARRARVTGASF